MENTGKVLFENDVPQWYIALGDRWVGPLAASDVYQKVLDQEISWAHFVWKPGQANWIRICDVEVFQAAVPALPTSSVRSEVKEAADTKKKTVRRPPAAPEEKEEEAESRIWFLYYNDSQFGPFSHEEICRFLRIGKIHGKVHAWREGLENWQRLEKLDTFAKALKEVPEASKDAQVSGPKVVKAAKRGEKRAEPRSPMVAKIVMASSEQVVTGVCRDVSIGGMQVLTNKLPGIVGAKIKINVSPAGPREFDPFVADGVIVRVLEDGLGFSFRFDKLSDRARRSIETYVSVAE